MSQNVTQLYIQLLKLVRRLPDSCPRACLLNERSGHMVDPAQVKRREAQSWIPSRLHGEDALLAEWEHSGEGRKDFN